MLQGTKRSHAREAPEHTCEARARGQTAETPPPPQGTGAQPLLAEGDPGTPPFPAPTPPLQLNGTSQRPQLRQPTRTTHPGTADPAPSLRGRTTRERAREQRQNHRRYPDPGPARGSVVRIYNWGTQPRGGEPERTAIHGPKPQPANGRHALGARLDQAAPRQGKQPASEKQNQQTSHKGPGKQRQTGARRQGGGSKASDKQATPGRDPRGKQTARAPQQSTALPQGLLSAGLPPNLAAATHCTKGSRSSQPKPRPQTCCASPTGLSE